MSSGHCYLERQEGSFVRSMVTPLATKLSRLFAFKLLKNQSLPISTLYRHSHQICTGLVLEEFLILVEAVLICSISWTRWWHENLSQYNWSSSQKSYSHHYMASFTILCSRYVIFPVTYRCCCKISHEYLAGFWNFILS